MVHPWEKIDLNTYEKHMSTAAVYQLQTLNKITEEQLTDYNSTTVSILGIAGGNGLDIINNAVMKKIYCIDVNGKYLEAVKIRYSCLLDVLEFICCDLTNNDVILPVSDLYICNLIIEYLGIETFAKLLKRSWYNMNKVSCVIQKNNAIDFVSPTNDAAAFNPILSIHHDIHENNLIRALEVIGLTCINRKNYSLPNNKEFIRMDFKKVEK